MSEREFINLCKKLIQERYLLGSADGQWKQRDFDQLTRIIEEKSGIRISLSTLRRIWKSDYHQNPHPATLDALASLLNYSDWLDFKNAQHANSSPFSSRLKFSSGLIIGSILIIALSLVGVLVISSESAQKRSVKKPKPIATGPVRFSTNKTVSSGVPNTVIFKYDVQNISADSFYLQQSWNELHRVSIDPSAGNYSSIYYTPGFHRAKLLADDSIFSISRIHIKTNGWLSLIKYNRDDLVPIYLRDPDITRGGTMHVSEEHLVKAGVDTQRNFLLNYHNTQDFGLHSDNFQISTRIKCDSIGNYPCPQFNLTLVCEEHIFYFPLTTKGCVANIGIKVGEVIHDSQDSDLSAFGRDMYQWQDLTIAVQNKLAQVKIADTMVLSTNFKQDFGKIMGVVLTFTGTGTVQYVELGEVNSNPVLADSFL